MVFCAFSAASQSRQEQYLDYIERYKQVALEQEREFGVPASITLAQGILESSVGQSKMAREANNHFGIKAYNWQGEVYGQGGVGYRKYAEPEDSYLDHTRVLLASRYSVLYELEVTDLKLDKAEGKGYKGVLTGKLNGEEAVYDVKVTDEGSDFDIDWEKR